MISGSQDVMNAADGATTGRRIRISRRGDENERCKASRALDRRKDFSQRMAPSRIPSTSNAISPQQKRTEPFGLRRWTRGAQPPPPPENGARSVFLRSPFDNLTAPLQTKPFKLVAVALANKIPRITFAIMRGKTSVRKVWLTRTRQALGATYLNRFIKTWSCCSIKGSPSSGAIRSISWMCQYSIRKGSLVPSHEGNRSCIRGKCSASFSATI